MPAQLLETTFKAAWWLKNPHLQTLYPVLLRRLSPLHCVRERLTTPDNDFIDLDWYGQAHQPLVILLHGLTGSSQSGYIQGLQQQLSANGFRSVALNFRGCSGESNRLARCYHSGDTEDIHFLYQTVRQREPATPIAAVGFSLGANVLLKWLGEQQKGVNLFAAVAISTPFLLNHCASKLDKGFSKFYRNRLLAELRTYLNDKRQALAQTGQTDQAARLTDLGDLSDIDSFWQYDERVVAKLYGFQSAADFYQRASSRQFLKTIAVPTLLIQALDDPFMTAAVIPDRAELSSDVQLEITPHGGHVGFIAGHNPFKPSYWLEQRVVQFLQQLLQNPRLVREP